MDVCVLPYVAQFGNGRPHRFQCFDDAVKFIDRRYLKKAGSARGRCYRYSIGIPEGRQIHLCVYWQTYDEWQAFKGDVLY